jgi:subtilisin-like proprotein convertase family protein
MHKQILLFYFLFQLLSLHAQTFSKTENQILPDDGSTVSFEIEVNNLPEVIDTLFGLETVCLNINHPYDEDMNVSLEAPNGQIILLFAGVGGGGQNFTNTCVAGQGLNFSLENPPFSGIYQCYGVLGNVNRGQNPNGIWKLVIYDTYAGADQGFLVDWSISFGENPAFPFLFKSSDLPIVKLTTLAAPIDNDPKVPVLMQIIDNGAGIRNFTNQTDYAYEGKIMTEWQGFSGPFYPKKNYDFELVDSLNNAMDSTIFGMSRESDWIFKAEYLDHTLIKNSVTYEMARRMGRYAPHTAPCEIVLDGEYIGVYFLTEKVKRDKNRVNIAKMTATDLEGSALTGGYIFEMNINGDPADWVSDYLPINSATCPASVEFKFVYPKSTKIEPQQANYLKNYTSDFEDVLKGSNFMDTTIGYRKWIDVSTFIDFLIVNEFSINYDSYGRSTYLYKEKDTDGGLLKIGPPWDYDRAYDYNYPDALNVWVWERTHDFWPFPFWWSRMWQDPSFRQQLACRWQNLRENTLKTTEFNGIMDSLAIRLEESQSRNFTVWKDLGALTYPAHLESLKAFVGQRLLWMDSTLAAEHPLATFTGQQNASNTTLWSFYPTLSIGQSYLWDFGDGSTSTLQNPVHQYLSAENYKVTLTIGYGFGCTTSAEITLDNVLLEAGENPKLVGEIFPNPFSDHIYMKNAPENAIFELTNALGQVVFLGKNIEKQDFSRLVEGVYFLKVLGGKELVFKVLKKN